MYQTALPATYTATNTPKIHPSSCHAIQGPRYGIRPTPHMLPESARPATKTQGRLKTANVVARPIRTRRAPAAAAAPGARAPPAAGRPVRPRARPPAPPAGGGAGAGAPPPEPAAAPRAPAVAAGKRRAATAHP